MNKLLIAASLLLFTSCETCITARMFPRDGNNVYQTLEPAKNFEEKSDIKDEIINEFLTETVPGIGYCHSCQAAFLATGDGYEESKDRAENADEYLPPGEHPLDDENLDDWDGNLGYAFGGRE